MRCAENIFFFIVYWGTKEFWDNRVKSWCLQEVQTLANRKKCWKPPPVNPTIYHYSFVCFFASFFSSFWFYFGFNQETLYTVDIFSLVQDLKNASWAVSTQQQIGISSAIAFEVAPRPHLTEILQGQSGMWPSNTGLCIVTLFRPFIILASKRFTISELWRSGVIQSLRTHKGLWMWQG